MRHPHAVEVVFTGVAHINYYNYDNNCWQRAVWAARTTGEA